MPVITDQLQWIRSTRGGGDASMSTIAVHEINVLFEELFVEKGAWLQIGLRWFLPSWCRKEADLSCDQDL